MILCVFVRIQRAGKRNVIFSRHWNRSERHNIHMKIAFPRLWNYFVMNVDKY